MNTKYIVRRIEGSRSRNISKDTKLGDAMAKYGALCEEYPQETFRVVRSVTLEEVVAESDDYRQARFDFAD